MSLIMIIIIAYCLGSLNSAILMSRWLGTQDPRHIGSGNAGTTNMLRINGKKAALITLAGDVLKGVIALLLARLMSSPYAQDAALIGVFLGHVYPVFFRFQGGKGIATLLGAWIGFAPGIALLLLGTWVIVAMVTRYSSLAGIIAALCAPGYTYLSGLPALTTGITLCISLIVLWKHQANIKRLWQRTESKISFKR